MRLRELELDEFRSFRRLHLAFDPAGVRLIGPNASGKSTLLEAITMLATMRSPRTSSEREIANWQSGEELSVPPFARARGIFERNDNHHSVELALTLDPRGSGAFKKLIRFDDRPARAVDVVGELKTVLFSPEDVNLVSGPPSARRRYLDIAISQGSKPYLRALSQYGRVLEQRNSLLRGFARDRAPATSSRQADELAFWDAELTSSAVEVLAVRKSAVKRLSELAHAHFVALVGMQGLTISYDQHRLEPHELEAPGTNWQAPMHSFRQSLAASFAASLTQWRAEELRRGVSAIGPHRDDFVVKIDDMDLGRYGSRGQQRLALIALKLAERDMLHEAANEPPILLLDDVLSELDARHRTQVVAALASSNSQICVTSTDMDEVGLNELRGLALWMSFPGKIVSHDHT